MQPRTKYRMTILGLTVAGILFLAFGFYCLATFVGRRSSPRLQAGLLFGGGGAIFIGLNLLGQAIQWTRPVKMTPQSNHGECPYCGATIEQGTTFCQKCRNQLREIPGKTQLEPTV